jgi:signal transduction histidine kinase
MAPGMIIAGRLGTLHLVAMGGEPEERSDGRRAEGAGGLVLWASGAWVLPFLGAVLWLFPASPAARTALFILGALAAPLPALLLMRRQRRRLLGCAEQAEESAAQLKLQLDTVRFRTARLREELQAADRQARLSHQLTLLGQFTAGFMHEFNNPLAIVAGRIEVLLEERKEDGACARICNRCSKRRAT